MTMCTWAPTSHANIQHSAHWLYSYFMLVSNGWIWLCQFQHAVPWSKAVSTPGPGRIARSGCRAFRCGLLTRNGFLNGIGQLFQSFMSFYMELSSLADRSSGSTFASSKSVSAGNSVCSSSRCAETSAFRFGHLKQTLLSVPQTSLILTLL